MKIKKTYLLTEGLIEKINKIKEHKSYGSATQVIFDAIDTMHQKLFPMYMVQRLEATRRTPEERAEMSILIQQKKKDLEEKPYLDLAEQLGGKVFSDGGFKYVKYFTYHNNRRWLQQLPLFQLTQEIVDIQYSPSKEEVLKRQAAKSVDYDPTSWDE